MEKIPEFYWTMLINCLGKLSMIISWFTGLGSFFMQHSLPLQAVFLCENERNKAERQMVMGIAIASIVFFLMAPVSFLDEDIRRNVTELPNFDWL